MGFSRLISSCFRSNLLDVTLALFLALIADYRTSQVIDGLLRRFNVPIQLNEIGICSGDVQIRAALYIAHRDLSQIALGFGKAHGRLDASVVIDRDCVPHLGI